MNLRVRACTALMLCALFSACSKNDTPAPSKPDNTAVYNAMVETRSPVQKAITTFINNNCGGLYRTLPALYDSTSKRYPLLIALHGAPELGDGSSQLPILLQNGIPQLVQENRFPASFSLFEENFSFVILAPQFKTWPSAADVDEVIKYGTRNLRIDSSRVYLVGLSMGGGVTWEYAAAYGNKVAAIVPISGASAPTPAAAKVIASNNIRVWAFHNEDDPTVPVQNTLNFIGYINSNNPNTKAIQTIWPSGGHDAWTRALAPTFRENGRNVYEWLLQYKR